jgi:hypothetical protein
MPTNLPAVARARYFAWAIVLGTLCYAIFRVGIGAAMIGSPDAKLRIAPDNAAALVAVSTRELNTLQRGRLSQASVLARQAYAREPISSGALRQLGAISSFKGDPEKARALVQQSERLSKRDFTAQLILIEDAVNRGDVTVALRHYDIALRTSKRASAVLFEPLSSATNDDALITPLAQLLAKRPPWANFYLLQAASTSPSPRNMANLIITLQKTGFPVAPLALESLTGRLLQTQDYQSAWAVFSTVDQAAVRDKLRDPGFKNERRIGLPFDWSFDVSGSASAEVVVDAKGNHMAFNAPVGTGGLVARQMTLLPPGNYKLSTIVAENNVGNDNAPMWRLRCADNSSVLAVLPLPIINTAARRAQVNFTVKGCEAQWLELILTATDDPQGVVGAIDHVAISRISKGVGA